MATRHRFQVDGELHTILVDELDEGFSITIDGGEPIVVDAALSGVPGLFSLIVDNTPSRAFVSREGMNYHVTVEGRTFLLGPAVGGRGRGAIGGASDPPGQITAPLAGVVVDIRTSVGDTVEAGQPLVVIEAMKMQNEVQAPLPGTITAIRCEQGARVEKGDLVIEYEPSEG